MASDLDPQPAARPDCVHHWTFHLKGGEPLSVGICTLCGDPNWDDLRRQLSELDGATAEPGPNVQCSTPGEFAARWNSLDEEQRAAWLRGIHEWSDAAERCWMTHRKPRRFDSITDLVADTQQPDDPGRC